MGSFRLALPLLLAATAAFGTPSGKKWTTLPPGYRVFSHASINGVANFSTAVLPKVQAGYATWTNAQVGCTSWNVTYLGAFSTPTGTAAINGGDGQNRVIWQSGGNWRYGGSVLGVTTTSYIPSTGQITDGDMEMNNNVVWSVTGSASAFDVQSVVLHEAGHFLGLDHTNDTAAVMYPSIAQGQSKVTLGTADLNDVCTVYPSSGGALATITVTPNPASLAINGTQQFTATGKDSSGNAVPVTPVWSVVSGGGSINASGLFTAGSTTGTFTNTVRATSGTIFGSATVVISAGAVASITVSPNPANVAVGGAQQFTAVGRDSGGNVVPFTPVWGIAAGGGTINGSGIFTAGTVPGTFTNTVTCSSGSVTGTASVVISAGPLASITVTPASGSVGVGGTRQYSAQGTDAYGNPVPMTPAWAVVNGGGTVSSSGLFTAGTVSGTFTQTVEASSGAIRGTATAVVNPGPVATITVSPASTSLSIGTTQQFTAAGKDSYGNTTSISPTWSVAAGGGSINGTGLFTAGSTAGTFTNTVRATSGTVVGQASVTVTAGALASVTVSPSPATVTVNATQQFTAVGKDSGGNEVPISPMWSVIAGGGTISASGLFTAGSTAGTYPNTVRAIASGFASSATVTVTSAVLASMTVSPGAANVAINQTQQFTASGTSTGGQPMAVSPTWSVVAGGGTISPTGLFSAGTTPGTYSSTVKATSGSVVAYAHVNVVAGPLATLTVVPDTASLAAGATIQLTASGKDSAGNYVPVTPGWAVVNGGGTISSGGLFTAGSIAGTFTDTVRATSGSVNGYATLTVNPGPLASIVLTPSPAMVAASGTLQFTATGKDASGNTVPVSPVWSAASGGTISTAGLFTAGATAGTFNNTVTATSGAVSASATVTVTPSAVANMTVSPGSASTAINGTVQFTAAGTDSGGNPVGVSPVWSVVAGGGSISAGGLFTAGTAPGTFTNTVKATSGAVVAFATVTVTVGPLATISVAPSSATLAVGVTFQLAATGRDSAGNTVPFSPTWSVVSGGGTISASGQFTAGMTAGTFSNTIRASSGSVNGFATVVVIAGGPLATMTVSPNQATVPRNGTLQLTATGADASGNGVPVTPVWTVSGGGTISTGGLFSAGTTAGTFTVTATSGTVSATAMVTVTSASLASITLTPMSATIAVGGMVQFTATGTDSNGGTVAVSPIFTVASGGTISTTGLFTAGPLPGSYTVVATSGTVSTSASVTVTIGPLATIAISPSPASVQVSGSVAFTAQPRDAAGNAVTAPIVWSVANGGGAIDSSGTFTAGTMAGTFTDTVVATSGAVSGTATVSVTLGALASLTITPNPATVIAGGMLQLSAMGADAAGNPLQVATGWSVVGGAGAVDPAGMFTGSTAGVVTVRATSGTVSATTMITVQPGAIVRIDVSPAAVMLAAGEKRQLTAAAFDGFNNAVSPASFDWLVATPAAGTITAAGELTGGTVAGDYPDAIAASSGAVIGRASVSIVTGMKMPEPCAGARCEPPRGCGCSTGFGGGAFVLLALMLARRTRSGSTAVPRSLERNNRL